MRAEADTTAWARRYRTALNRYLRQEPPTRQASAENLGCQAAALGLETLTIVGLHEQALRKVSALADAPDNVKPEIIERAEIFFKRTIVPIEATHAAARKADLRIDQLTSTLDRRTGELSEVSDRLEQATSRRKTTEAQSEQGGSRHDPRIKEAKEMQNRLRDCMRGLLAQQEGERKAFGDELRNEIAQALLAIDLCLLALNSTAQANTGKLDKSIAEAQRLLQNVLPSGQTVSL